MCCVSSCLYGLQPITDPPFRIYLNTSFETSLKKAYMDMGSTRPCGCKGCRTCLECESIYGIERKDYCTLYKTCNSYVYCPKCDLAYKGWDVDEVTRNHSNHNSTEGLIFPGVLVQEDFLSPSECKDVMKQLDEMPWQGSQSGRRKQNFGPKTNFKKRKIKTGCFDGFPQFSKFIQDKFKDVSSLRDFQTIEQCSLEYESSKGACIDPHIDDCWIWGERVVTVNCLGDSVLTLSPYKGDKEKYNLSLVADYESCLEGDLMDEKTFKKYENIILRIPMPNRSLIVMYGAARYQFEHSVLREDIAGRRVCIAYREFTPMYMKNGDSAEKGEPVTEIAQQFWDHLKKNWNDSNYACV